MRLQQAAESLRQWFQSPEYLNNVRVNQMENNLPAVIDAHLKSIDKTIESLNKISVEMDETDEILRRLIFDEADINESIKKATPPARPVLTVVRD